MSKTYELRNQHGVTVFTTKSAKDMREHMLKLHKEDVTGAYINYTLLIDLKPMTKTLFIHSTEM
jgi:hypothetical protein